MIRPTASRSWLLPAGIVAVLAVVVTLGFRGVFPDFTFVATSVVGAIGATSFALLARSFRLHLPESILISIVAFIGLGAVATGGLPTGGAYRTFFDGLINGWARILTSIPPATLDASYRVLPYTVAWFSALIGVEFLRTRQPALAVIGPLLGLMLTSLIALEDRRVALAQGAMVALGMLTLGWLQQRQQSHANTNPVPAGRKRREPGWSMASQIGGAMAMASIAAVGAIYLGPRLPDVADRDRFDLRQIETPPFNPLSVPTPLGQVKVGLQDANADKVVFTVTSAERVDRFALAVLENYNDEYWLAGDETVAAAAQFRPVDTRFPGPLDGSIEGWKRVEATITMADLASLANGDLRSPWLPTPGWPAEVLSDPSMDLRFNTDTGTIAVAPEGVPADVSYSIVAYVPPPIEELSLVDATITPREPIDLVAPQLRSFAADTFEGADFGWQQVEAVRSRFIDTGSYDSRAQRPSARAGHSLGRLAEFVSQPDQIVGFEEQYAATAAALLRSEGVPVRVVVGFAIADDEWSDRAAGDTVSVVASDISAWIEVRFDNIGWIPFDVTPPRDRLPQDTPVGKTETEIAYPNEPTDPPPPIGPNNLELSNSGEEESSTPDATDPAITTFPWAEVAVAGAAALPIAIGLAAIVGIVAMKRRRTRRRRAAPDPALRIAGAWYEVIDRCREQGAPPRRAATTLELARGLGETELLDEHEGSLLVALAADVDRAAFAPVEPDDMAADEAWSLADLVTTGVAQRRSFGQRLRARLDPRPLMRPDPVQLSRREEANE